MTAERVLPRFVRITSDGRAHNTRIFDVDTGVEITEAIRSLDLYIDAKHGTKCEITFAVEGFELIDLVTEVKR